MARAKRLKKLRLLTGLSRKAFATKYDIPNSTLQYWEDGTTSQLTEDGAQKCVKSLMTEGIDCTVEWLLYGSGTTPLLPYDLNDEGYFKPVYAKIANELTVCDTFGTLMDAIVSDDRMMPYYHIGGYVAGRRYTELELIDRLIGHPCIVHTQQDEIWIRMLLASKRKHFYQLACLSKKTTQRSKTLKNVEAISIAPIIWHRRVDPINGK